MIKHIIKNNNYSNNIQIAYIGLKPKSFHIIKYSQPLELVLFHIINPSIKCHKGSHYPHLLNNYLKFSGLTGSTHVHVHVGSLSFSSSFDHL